MKAVVIHALLAVFGLGFAYETWTRKPEQESAPGIATVADCSPDQFQKLSLSTATQELSVEPVKDHGQIAYWITQQNKPAPDHDKDKDKADAGVAVEAKKPPEPPRRFLANAAFAEYFKRLTPLRARRSLGKLAADKDADFGFDKVTTHLGLECAGRKLELEAGGKSFGGSQRYARDQKSKVTYLLDDLTIADLESAQFKFMQADLHGFANDAIEEVTVEARGAKAHLLQRDRKVPDHAQWVDASNPDKRNEVYGNWFSRLQRMRARMYLPSGAEPGSDLKGSSGGTEPVLSIDYKLADKPNGKLELVRVDENGVGHYYARTETTQTWVAVYDSSAKEVEQDVGMVVGLEQAPSKHDLESREAAQQNRAINPHAMPMHPAPKP
jgi:hypothetical protein